MADTTFHETVINLHPDCIIENPHLICMTGLSESEIDSAIRTVISANASSFEMWAVGDDGWMSNICGLTCYEEATKEWIAYCVREMRNETTFAEKVNVYFVVPGK